MWIILQCDEKWFYIKRDKKIVKLLPGQTAQQQAVKHKSHIVKIMFVAVIGVPQTLPDGTWFDGKLGIWPMTEMAPAVRNSANRPAGAPVITPINMNCENYRHLCLGEGGVLEKIKQKLGCCRNARIVIQHDGATPHTGEGTEAALNMAGVEDGWNIQWERQPAQSPDCNKCDLGFFASLQKKVFEANTDMKSMSDLTNAMMTAANEYDCQTLERLHATQYAVFREILKAGGKNDYKLPHTGVTARQSRGEVVADLRIPTNIFNFARTRLAELNDA